MLTFSQPLSPARLALSSAPGCPPWFFLLLQWWPGALSIRDLGADGIGVAAALAALVAAEARRRPSAAGATSRLQQQQPAEGMA